MRPAIRPHRFKVSAALACAVCLGAAWPVWQMQPAWAVAGAVDRVLGGAAPAADLDDASLRRDLAPQIGRVLDDEAATARRWAAAADTLRGIAAAFHLVAMLPVLLAEPIAPRAAARAKAVQAGLLPDPPAPRPDTGTIALAQAARLSRPDGVAGLVRAALARAPEEWPESRIAQFRFVLARLERKPDGGLELPLEPSGIAPGWRGRLTVLEFRRAGPGVWRLRGIRLPPEPGHARAVLDRAGTAGG